MSGNVGLEHHEHDGVRPVILVVNSQPTDPMRRSATWLDLFPAVREATNKPPHRLAVTIAANVHMDTAPAVIGPPRTTSCASFRRCRLLFREPWFEHFVRRAVAAALIANAAGCGGEPVGPNSDQLMIVVAPFSDVGLFELDSAQLTAAFSGGPTLPSSAVSWTVSGGGFATVSPTGLLKAIRATDFDRPANPLGWPITITATVGTHSTSDSVYIGGWQKPLAPALDGVAYMSDRWYSSRNYWGSFSGIDQAGEPYAWWGSLVLTCGTVVPGKWTVEINPDDMDNPLMNPSRNLFSTDTVAVVFDDEPRRLERWQRVGLRLRAPDGDEMVRRMRRARPLGVIAQSYSPDRPPIFAFRLGNVELVTQAAAFRACA